MKTLKISSFPAEFRIHYLSNTSLELYRHTNILLEKYYSCSATQYILSIGTRMFIITLNFQSPVATICTTCFNISKPCIIPTECIFVFRMVLTLNIDYFPKQH
jgi:hypothetical protein